jgi:SseB protein N-terminal domain
MKWRTPIDEGLGPDTMLLARRTEADVDLPEGELVVAADPVTLELLITPTKDGRKALLAFSSEDELLDWFPEGGPYVEMLAEDLLQLAFKHDFDVALVAMSADCVFEISREEFMQEGASH